MKLSIFVLVLLSYSFAADAARLRKPLNPRQVTQALKSGRSITVAFANEKSDGCIGVDRASKEAGVPLKRFRCGLPLSSRPNNQYWILKPIKGEPGEAGYFTIVNSKSDKCMGVDHGSSLPGEDIRQFVCDNRAISDGS